MANLISKAKVKILNTKTENLEGVDLTKNPRKAAMAKAFDASMGILDDVEKESFEDLAKGRTIRTDNALSAYKNNGVFHLLLTKRKELSLAKLANFLNEQNITTNTGLNWTPQLVKRAELVLQAHKIELSECKPPFKSGFDTEGFRKKIQKLRMDFDGTDSAFLLLVKETITPRAKRSASHDYSYLDALKEEFKE